MHPKVADKMASRVDPDQSAQEQSDVGLTVCQDLSVRKLGIITAQRFNWNVFLHCDFMHIYISIHAYLIT